MTASTPACPIAAMEDAAHGFYAVQFHPEVVHTPLAGLLVILVLSIVIIFMAINGGGSTREG